MTRAKSDPDISINKDGGRSGRRNGSGRDSGGITINNNNNVYVNGNIGQSYYPRPYDSHRYHTRLHYDHFRHNSHWYDHGGYYSLRPWYRSCGSIVSFSYGHHNWGVSYYYPQYHRKYVFCSVGGYWPSSYRYRRYYWYGTHPYRWYGSNVIAQPVAQDTYNTYNTYNTYDSYSSQPTQTTYTTGNDYYYDAGNEDFSDVREKLAQQTAAPDAQDFPEGETTADACFGQAVDLFAQGKYEQAVFKFRVAMILDPEDVVLPFAYLQALFATSDYQAAAAVLRTTLSTPAEQEGTETVFYPRGLYANDEILQNQINSFAAVAALQPGNADYQLLLGYQFLGSGRLDEAITPLHKALELDIENSPSMTLIELLERIKADEAAAAQQQIEDAQNPAPSPVNEKAIKEENN